MGEAPPSVELPARRRRPRVQAWVPRGPRRRPPLKEPTAFYALAHVRVVAVRAYFMKLFCYQAQLLLNRAFYFKTYINCELWGQLHELYIGG